MYPSFHVAGELGSEGLVGLPGRGRAVECGSDMVADPNSEATLLVPVRCERLTSSLEVRQVSRRKELP
jgi:hypothetical protein